MVRPKPQLCPYTGQLQTRKDDTTNPRLSWFLSPSLQSRGRDRILTNSHPWNRKQSPSNFVFNILARDLSLTVLSCAFPIRAGCVWLQLYWPALSRSITVMCGSKIRTTHSTVIRAARAGDPHTLTLLLFLPPSVLGPRVYSVVLCSLCSAVMYILRNDGQNPDIPQPPVESSVFQIPTSSSSWSAMQEHMQ